MENGCVCMYSTKGLAFTRLTRPIGKSGRRRAERRGRWIGHGRVNFFVFHQLVWCGKSDEGGGGVKVCSAARQG